MADERGARTAAVVGLVALTLGLWLLPAKASAYIDPGTGSLVLQGLIAVLVTAGLLARSFWSRLIGVFRRRNPGLPAPEDQRTPKGRAE